MCALWWCVCVARVVRVVRSRAMCVVCMCVRGRVVLVLSVLYVLPALSVLSLSGLIGVSGVRWVMCVCCVLPCVLSVLCVVCGPVVLVVLCVFCCVVWAMCVMWCYPKYAMLKHVVICLLGCQMPDRPNTQYSRCPSIVPRFAVVCVYGPARPRACRRGPKCPPVVPVCVHLGPAHRAHCRPVLPKFVLPLSIPMDMPAAELIVVPFRVLHPAVVESLVLGRGSRATSVGSRVLVHSAKNSYNYVMCGVVVGMKCSI